MRLDSSTGRRWSLGPVGGTGRSYDQQLVRGASEQQHQPLLARCPRRAGPAPAHWQVIRSTIRCRSRSTLRSPCASAISLRGRVVGNRITDAPSVGSGDGQACCGHSTRSAAAPMRRRRHPCPIASPASERAGWQLRHAAGDFVSETAPSASLPSAAVTVTVGAVQRPSARPVRFTHPGGPHGLAQPPLSSRPGIQTQASRSPPARHRSALPGADGLVQSSPVRSCRSRGHLVQAILVRCALNAAGLQRRVQRAHLPGRRRG